MRDLQELCNFLECYGGVSEYGMITLSITELMGIVQAAGSRYMRGVP